jgi:hypothetical protein
MVNRFENHIESIESALAVSLKAVNSSLPGFFASTDLPLPFWKKKRIYHSFFFK